MSYNENLNYNKSLTAIEKIQFSLSGIESNLLIAGILLLLSFVVNNDLSHTLISVANANIIMAILNSLPALGLDGEKALSALLDVESIFIVALEWMLFKSERKQLLKQGIVGYLCFAFFCFILIAQVIVALTIISDIIIVILLIFISAF